MRRSLSLNTFFKLWVWESAQNSKCVHTYELNPRENMLEAVCEQKLICVCVRSFSGHTYSWMPRHPKLPFVGAPEMPK